MPMPEGLFENVKVPRKDRPTPWNKCDDQIFSLQAGGRVQDGPWNHNSGA